jgi:hypothetical protein
MRSFVRLLVTVILLGAAIQQGWPQAGARLVGLLFGAHPALAPEAGVAGLVDGTIGSLAGTIRSLPDPWFTLAVMIAGVIGVILLVSVVRTAVNGMIRFNGWLRDLSV